VVRCRCGGVLVAEDLETEPSWSSLDAAGISNSGAAAARIDPDYGGDERDQASLCLTSGNYFR
jgi:hypothetical protein